VVKNKICQSGKGGGEFLAKHLGMVKGEINQSENGGRAK